MENKNRMRYIPTYNPLLMSVDVFGNYLKSNIRRKRRIQAKQGKLLTKQGRKRSV